MSWRSPCPQALDAHTETKREALGSLEGDRAAGVDKWGGEKEQREALVSQFAGDGEREGAVSKAIVRAPRIAGARLHCDELAAQQVDAPLSWRFLPLKHWPKMRRLPLHMHRSRFGRPLPCGLKLHCFAYPAHRAAFRSIHRVTSRREHRAP